MTGFVKRDLGADQKFGGFGTKLIVAHITDGILISHKISAIETAGNTLSMGHVNFSGHNSF